MADQSIAQRTAMKATIVDDEGRILILREAGESYGDGTKGGLWGLPGGRVEPGENWQDALNREIFEETGLKVEYSKPIYVGEWSPIIKRIKTQIIAVFNLCRYKGGEIKLSEEHDQYAWVSEQELSDYNFKEPDEEVVRIALKQS